MWYIIIFALAASGIIAGFTGFTSCANANNSKVNTPPDSIKGSYSRAEVEQMLENLATSKVKDNLEMGAMCYSPRQIAEHADYICPVCGEKTIYSWQQAEFVLHELPSCREYARRFDKNTVLLDESQFCRKCTPDSIENPQLCLSTKLEGQESVKTCGVYPMDLVILIDFFEGKNIYKTDNDSEVALKERIPRIKQLLGIKD